MFFQVRQWPGNGGDLDFRGVIRGCGAVVVACAPFPGKLMADQYDDGWALNAEKRDEFMASAEYAQAAKLLPFCRLWCIVELFAALSYEKFIIFRCLSVVVTGGRVTVSTEGGADMLFNCANIVAVSKGECAVEADKKRELALIDDQAEVNRKVAAAVTAGAVALNGGVVEVDAYACGEPEALRALPSGRLVKAAEAAASAGLTDALAEVLALLQPEDDLGYALWIAAHNGRLGALRLLMAFSRALLEYSKVRPAVALL